MSLTSGPPPRNCGEDLPLPAARRSFRFMDARPRSEIAPQFGGGLFGLSLEIEWSDEAPFFVHQVNNRGMIHGVFAAVQRHFLAVDAIALSHLCDCRRVAGQRTEMRIEAREIFLEFLRRVALRIDRDENRTCPIRLFA